jgi:DNA-binding PadR family transcriptional regulator
MGKQHDELLPLSPLSMAILLSLADGDRHGYALMEEIERQTEGAVRPGTGSLYAGLQRLMADGLIRESDGEAGADRRRRYYAITDAGREMARAEARRMLRVLNIAAKKDLSADLTALGDAG